MFNVTCDTHGTNEKCDTLLVRKYHGKRLLWRSSGRQNIVRGCKALPRFICLRITSRRWLLDIPCEYADYIMHVIFYYGFPIRISRQTVYPLFRIFISVHDFFFINQAFTTDSLESGYFAVIFYWSLVFWKADAITLLCDIIDVLGNNDYHTQFVFCKLNLATLAE